jgi:3-hydroxybutyryl-CoA dehydratase
MTEAPKRAAFRKTMTTAEQALFTGISGNLHPLYVNAIHAKAVSGGDMLVFELALASLATTALATVGGAHRRISALSLRFPNPAQVGETVEAKVEVQSEQGGLLKASILCTGRDGAVLAEGNAEMDQVGRG